MFKALLISIVIILSGCLCICVQHTHTYLSLEYYYKSQEKTGYGQNIVNSFTDLLNIDKLNVDTFNIYK